MRLNKNILSSLMVTYCCGLMMMPILAAPVSTEMTLMDFAKLFKLISQRIQRQVVQPTWLVDGDAGTGPQFNEVTPQSLQEAAEIRASLQKAIREGLFAISTGFEGNENFLAPTESAQSWLPPQWSLPLQWTWQWPILSMLGAPAPEPVREVETTTPPPPETTTTTPGPTMPSIQQMQDNFLRMFANSKMSFNWDV